jgi:uncharacterized membrane protein
MKENTTQMLEKTANTAGLNGAPSAHSGNGQDSKAAPEAKTQNSNSDSKTAPAQPAASQPAAKENNINVGQTERKVSTVAGGALTVFGLWQAISKRSWSGLLWTAMGGALLARGTTGHCHAYGALGVDTSEDPAPAPPPAPPTGAPAPAAPAAASTPAAPPAATPAVAPVKEAIKDAAQSVTDTAKNVTDTAKSAVDTAVDSAKEAVGSAKEAVGDAKDAVKDAVKDKASIPALTGTIHVEKSVTIAKPAQELYEFWRDFSNLPQFMKHLEAVHVHNDKRSQWIAQGPAGAHIEWEAEITEEKPGKLIAWKSLPEADVPNTGSVRFRTQGNNTKVTVTMDYSPTGGILGAIFAQLWGEEPSQQVEEDLNNLKSLMESGEIASEA